MRNGLPIIRHFEGCKLKAYPDPATGGVPWTIGWGRTTGVKRGDTCAQAQADAWLIAEYDHFESEVLNLTHRHGTDNQIGALTAFAYNVGLVNLKSSTLLKRHLAGEYVEAAAEFAHWSRANEKIMAGLTTRRAAEAALYLS
ncbi:lysozyme [Sphingomonas populi]|uniref:Lysozyme n=1 Tax=Sphingomonas populi TaxID=2484750 RepID=A0A4Q6Y9K8_9SPHN|nr:lysozyme [Sphingomonas populi]RZF66527.1 lysozyme [Sphingomonas populi]